MTRLFHSLLGLALSLSFGAARSASEPAPAAPRHAYFHKTLSGTIGQKLHVTMDLKNADGRLTGSYRYGKRASGLELNGSIDASGSFVMDESIGLVKKTGRFEGRLTGGHLEGTWRSADGLRTLPFVADQTSEIVIGTKREMLSPAVGHYPLAHISSFAGANSMGDTFKENGHWRSFNSSINGGMREGQDTALSRADVALLDHLDVVIDPDLSVRLVATGKTVLQIPFRPDGLDYRLDRPHSSVISDKFKQISAATIVADERVYLAVRDGVDYSRALSGSFMASAGDIMTLSYSLVDKTVSIEFEEGECCDGSTWTFGPPPRIRR